MKTAVEVDRRAVILRNPLSARAASFRVLRHRLVDQGDPKAVVVTSAQDCEGKTTCALNLAWALAESGRNRVLLLEVNTARPALAGLLGFLPEDRRPFDYALFHMVARVIQTDHIGERNEKLWSCIRKSASCRWLAGVWLRDPRILD